MSLQTEIRPELPPVPAEPYIRIVPNGVSEIDYGTDRIGLKATLILTPLVKSALTGSFGDLTSWPKSIADLISDPNGAPDFSDFQLRCGLLSRESTKGCFELETCLDSDTDPDIKVAIRNRTFAETFIQESVRLTSCWQNSIRPLSKKVEDTEIKEAHYNWKTLGKRICAALDGTRTKPGAIKDPSEVPHPELEDEEFGDKGQFVKPPEQGDRDVDAIFGVPQADAAVALEMQRAKELVLSLGDGGEEQDRDLVTSEDPVDDIGPLNCDDAEIEKVLEDDRQNSINQGLPAKTDAKKVELIAPCIPFAPDLSDETLAPSSRELRGAIAKFERQFYRFISNPSFSEDDKNQHAAADAWRARSDNAKALEAARQSGTDEAIRKQKILRQRALSKALHDQRLASRKAFDTASNAMAADKAVVVCAPGGVTPADAAKDPTASIAGARCASEYAQWPQHITEDEAATRRSEYDALNGRRPDPTTVEFEERMGNAYFSIEGSASQARVFGLSLDVDIVLPVSALAGHHYVVLNVRRKAGPGYGTIAMPWTLTKLRQSGQETLDHGWPATTGEYFEWRKTNAGETPIFPSHCVPQFDGVVSMSGLPNTTGKRLPRYDISTLDVAVALEAERKWLEEVEDKRTLLGKSKTDKTLTRQLKALLSVGPDYQSNGLTLLCRSAANDAIRKLASRAQKSMETGACRMTFKGETYVVHDAEDLTSGIRAMIGMPSDLQGGTTWRPLMGRYFRFDESGTGGDLIETVLEAAIDRYGEDARIAIESATVATPARDTRAPKPAGKPAMPNAIESIVEETVVNWDGTPGGVVCANVEGENTTINDVMCFGRKAYVPGQGKLRPPRLQNGRPYRFGLQVVYAGGRAVDLSETPTEMLTIPDLSNPTDEIDLENKGDVRSRLYYPSLGLASQAKPSTKTKGKALPFVRALRHARVGAPTVLLPSGHAKFMSRPMGFESAGKMIVRSLRDTGGMKPGSRDRSRATPAISQRLLVVPHVPQTLAGRHLIEGENKGVFDNYDRETAPAGGLRGVHYARGRNGFPSVETTFRTGINGESYAASRAIRYAPSADSGSDEVETSSAVFEHRSGRRTDYYPDPSADYLVLRARRVAGPDGQRAILPGNPIVVPLNRATLPYPHKDPILLTMNRNAPRDERRALTQSAVIKHVGRRSFNANLSPEFGRLTDIRAGSRLRAASVELTLAPGDQFDFEMWFLPSPWRLAHDFAAIQSMVQFFCHHGEGDARDGNCTLEELRLGIQRYDYDPDTKTHGDKLPIEVKLELLKALTDDDDGIRYFGPGGDVLPGTKVMTKIGAVLHSIMRRHPLPEISAKRVMSAVHAVNVPSKDRAPAIEALRSGVDPFPSGACPDPDPGTPAPRHKPEPLRAIRPESLDAPVPGFSDEKAIAFGSKAYALKGEVKLDLERIDTIEVVARAVAPDTEVFDNPKRGRSLARRIAGTWPESIAGDGNLRKAREIYGFEVAEDGRTMLGEGNFMLLRIEGLPFPEDTAVPGKLRLDDYFLNTDEDKAALVSHRHAFPDGKARRMTVQVNGLARTAEYMTTSARVARSGDPWLRGSGLVYERNELIPPERLDRRLMVNLSEPREVILPATSRPAMVEAKAPLPVFEYERESLTTENGKPVLRMVRNGRVRIPLGRGWFSSGVDERLGIVLWPPNQELDDHVSLAENRIPLRPDVPCAPRYTDFPGGICPRNLLGDPPKMGKITRMPELLEFDDVDLGPGGSFVTRRGSDPVRMSDGPDRFESQIFLSKEAFPDLWRHPNDPSFAEFVPHTLMPLGDKPKGASFEGEGGSESVEAADVEPPMAVSLVTYQPRFDPEREEWYVDVLLRPGQTADSFVRFGLVRYQPHTRPELRCSRPIAQWAQPMPERRVSVRAAPETGEIELEITGPVAKGRKVELVPNIGQDFGDDQTNLDAPIMRVTAFREQTTPGGQRVQETLSLKGQELGVGRLERDEEDITEIGDLEVLELMVHEMNGIGTWTARFPAEFLAVIGTDVKLQIEEVEYFLPADFGAAEPVDQAFMAALRRKHWRRSGPRFSAIIDLGAFENSLKNAR